MPRKSEKAVLSGTKHDRRVKVTPQQKVEIRALYEAGGISQRKLALMFGVSRRLISFILFPEKQAENIKLRQERGGTMRYYDKEKHRKTVKEHREYKEKLYKKGKITIKIF